MAGSRRTRPEVEEPRPEVRARVRKSEAAVRKSRIHSEKLVISGWKHAKRSEVAVATSGTRGIAPVVRRPPREVEDRPSEVGEQEPATRGRRPLAPAASGGGILRGRGKSDLARRCASAPCVSRDRRLFWRRARDRGRAAIRDRRRRAGSAPRFHARSSPLPPARSGTTGARSSRRTPCS